MSVFDFHQMMRQLVQVQSPPLPPWVSELLAAILSLIMIAVMLYWFRPRKDGAGSADFVISVDGADVLFRGKFPARLEGMVEDFLLRDCAIDGPYEVRGRWDEAGLKISVVGANAEMSAQRIRNFLKLQVPPRLKE